jgi:predicted permease
VRLPRWWRPPRAEENLEKELQFDLEMAVQDRIARGETPEKARQSVLHEFGNVALVKEVTRDVWGSQWFEAFLQDTRFGLRMLRKNPGVTAIIVLTLALGIGANTAIFSVVNGVLLRPLPYRDPNRLVILSEGTKQRPDMSVSFPNYRDWTVQSRSFEQLAAFGPAIFNLTSYGRAERIQGRVVSSGFLATLGVRPIRGRDFQPEEDQAGAPPAAILSYGLWQRLGGDEQLVGQTLTLSGMSCTVVGILPQNFRFYYGQPEILFPLGQAMDRDQATKRDNHSSLYVVGRVRLAVSLGQARAEMNAIARSLEQAYPETNSGHHITVATIHQDLLGDIQPVLLVLFAGAGFVLLIACANVANLLLARATSREKEIMLRQALGASPARIFRQLLTESLLLCMLGGGCGILMAVWGVDSLLALVPRGVPRLNEVRLDAVVFGFALVISLLTGLLFGLAPAWEALRGRFGSQLKVIGRGSGESPRKRRLRSVLVVSEVALAVILLVGAGLSARSFLRLLTVQPGFDPKNVLTLQILLEDRKYDDPAQAEAFFRRLIEGMEVIPGVRSAATATPLVLSGQGRQDDFYVEGWPVPQRGEFPNSDYHMIDSGYFRTMAISLIRGRIFDESDRADSQLVVIINQTMAERFWPSTDPIGKRMRIGSPDNMSSWLKIVGVVGDVKQYGLDRDTRTQFYLPFTQRPLRYRTLLVRTTREPTSLTSAVRSKVEEIDKDQPIFNVRTLESMLSETMAPRLTAFVLLGLFSSLALLLAAVGIYGVLSYTVSQRTSEFGLRMALGAQRQDILRLVLGEGWRLALAGVVAGLLGAIFLTRFMSSVLYGVAPTDPGTFVGVALGLGCVALFACYVPARRATRIEPTVALRYE